MVSSHTDRTSPVVRGKWVLDNLLGAPPPPPPATCRRSTRTRAGGAKVLTMRERMEKHRRIRCAPAATSSWIPSGSRWRTSTPWAPGARAKAARWAAPSTRRACCWTAPRSTGVSRCGRRCCSDQEIFVGTVAEKLMTYALGRGVSRHRHADGAGHRAHFAAGRATGSRRSSMASSPVARSRCARGGAGAGRVGRFVGRTHRSERNRERNE